MTPYNQLQRRLVRKGQHREPILKPVFADPSNKELLAKLQQLGSINQTERFVKLYAKAARAMLGWSGVEAQLLVKLVCGYALDADSPELQASDLDVGHVEELKAEAAKQRRLQPPQSLGPALPCQPSAASALRLSRQLSPPSPPRARPKARLPKQSQPPARQRIGDSRWRPLELCYWPEQGKLPAKGKEYPGLGYKRVRDKPPKTQPAAAQ
ncbi:hypothetical protein QJQ45_007071 [Haematococcus lacustris]|nr:hypothetical protein QJQ45_007071 [Haematococcus lacustris]